MAAQDDLLVPTGAPAGPLGAGGERQSLGRLLVGHGLITQAALDAALAEQQRTGAFLDAILTQQGLLILSLAAIWRLAYGKQGTV